MKKFIVPIILMLVGACGAWVYLKASQDPGQQALASTAVCESLLTGTPEQIQQLPRCARHNIPQAICGFCDPKLIESFGICGGHNVPEVFCTQCSPILVAAFKVEGDWCAEHELPESQCEKCRPASPADDDDTAKDTRS